MDLRRQRLESAGCGEGAEFAHKSRHQLFEESSFSQRWGLRVPRPGGVVCTASMGGHSTYLWLRREVAPPVPLTAEAFGLRCRGLWCTAQGARYLVTSRVASSRAWSCWWCMTCSTTARAISSGRWS